MNNFKYLWILLVTCAYFQVNPSQITKFHPKGETSRIKQVVCYMVYQAGATAKEVAELMGGRDEAVVYWAKNKIQELIDPGRCQDKQLKKDIENLLKLTA